MNLCIEILLPIALFRLARVFGAHKHKVWWKIRHQVLFDGTLYVRLDQKCRVMFTNLSEINVMLITLFWVKALWVCLNSLVFRTELLKCRQNSPKFYYLLHIATDQIL